MGAGGTWFRSFGLLGKDNLGTPGKGAVHVRRLSREAQHLPGQADSPAFPAPERRFRLADCLDWAPPSRHCDGQDLALRPPHGPIQWRNLALGPGDRHRARARSAGQLRRRATSCRPPLAKASLNWSCADTNGSARSSPRTGP
jgi:hypothetical protein